MQKKMMTILGVSLLAGVFFLGASSAQAATAQSIHAVTHQSNVQNTSYSWDCMEVPMSSLHEECVRKNKQQNQDAFGNPLPPANQNN